jgi:hypothetical protein
MKNAGRLMPVIAAALAVTLWTVAGSIASAQSAPPPQGPPAASWNATVMPVQAITDALGADGKPHGSKLWDIDLTLLNRFYYFEITTYAQVGTPYMTETQYKDRPNEHIAAVPYILIYNVYGLHRCRSEAPFDHCTSSSKAWTLVQTLDVHISCDGWQTGSGILNAERIPGPVYLEGDQDFSGNEEFKRFVEVLLPKGLSYSHALTLPGGTGDGWSYYVNPACSTLGLTTTPQFSILYDGAVHRPIGVFRPEVTVRVTDVRRLTARTSEGATLYQPVENPHLELWAGYEKIHLILPPMVEGQTFVPGPEAVIQTPVPPDTGQLVLIANITYDHGSREDSAFAAFGKNRNFGDGTQTVTVPKTWTPSVWTTAGRPVVLTVKGYEVTVQISVPTFTIASGTPAGSGALAIAPAH